MPAETQDALATVDAGQAIDLRLKLFASTMPQTVEIQNQEMLENALSHPVNDVNAVDDNGEENGTVIDEFGSSTGSNDADDDDEKPFGAVEAVADVDITTQKAIVHVKKARDGDHGDMNEENNCPKKPDKPIPCPRCQSLDTKFCYFNNYNVNQPRHFCKNCQRYWTAGGTLRNVPVGSGRRKSKHSLPSVEQKSLVPNGLLVRADGSDFSQPLVSPVARGLSKHMRAGGAALSRQRMQYEVSSCLGLDSPPSSTVLNFGLDSPHHDASCPTSPYHQKVEVLHGCKTELLDGVNSRKDVSALKVLAMHPDENDMNADSFVLEKKKGLLGVQPPDARETVSSMANTPQASMDSKQDMNSQLGISPMDTVLKWATNAPFSLLTYPWTYPASPSCFNVPLQAHFPRSDLFPSNNTFPQGVVPPTFQTLDFNAGAFGNLWAAGFPWPLMLQNPLCAPPCWGGVNWNMPWGSAAVAAAAAASAIAAAAAAGAASIPSTSIVGKRQSEGEPELIKGSSPLVPKTLRIGDPDAAARSSIWTTLGIGNRLDSLASHAMFDAFNIKTNDKEATNDLCSEARLSNPAALTRSISFHESALTSSQNVDSTCKSCK